jgi:hypothetical protein
VPDQAIVFGPIMVQGKDDFLEVFWFGHKFSQKIKFAKAISSLLVINNAKICQTEFCTVCKILLNRAKLDHEELTT